MFKGIKKIGVNKLKEKEGMRPGFCTTIWPKLRRSGRRREIYAANINLRKNRGSSRERQVTLPLWRGVTVRLPGVVLWVWDLCPLGNFSVLCRREFIGRCPVLWASALSGRNGGSDV